MEKAMHLNDEHIKFSWTVLKNYANMSSPLVIFIGNEEIKKAINIRTISGLCFL